MATMFDMFKKVSKEEYQSTFARTSQEIAESKTGKKQITTLVVGRPRLSIFSPPSSPTASVRSSLSSHSSDSKRSSKYVNWFQPHLIKEIENAVKKKR